MAGAKGKGQAQKAPEAHHGYEFGGPLGTGFLIIFLPILVYIFAFSLNEVSGLPPPTLMQPSSFSLDALKSQVGWPEEGIRGLFDPRVTQYVLGYYALHVLLHVLLPGEEVQGTPLACGGRHVYKTNAFSAAALILGGCAGGSYVYGSRFPLWTFLWDNYVQVITANMLICSFIALYVYAESLTVPKPGQPNPKKRELAPGGHTGNPIYDFFIGRELNPRITLPIPFVSEASKTIDIKVFCELRPGLLGWLLLNLSNVAHQYRVNSGHATSSILLITAFQGFYVLESYYMEDAIFTTMDVIMDGFGYMLSFGDLVWVPFFYSVQTRYLAICPSELGPESVALVLVVQSIGYYIFRSANNQKNRFRTNPEDPRVRHLDYMETAVGSRLLTSGWWGYARHINYLGDWIMSWSFCLPTGLAGYVMVEQMNAKKGVLEKHAVQTDEVRGWGIPITYFYILYFAILLVHRERRDEAKCRRKYGADWDKYTSKVKSRIVPGIY